MLSQLRKLLLVGQPNVGKSLIFTRLTHRYATVSNYPGTTVEITSALADLGGELREVVDTPGTNTLAPQSHEERVTRDLLLAADDADVVQVGDISNLRRTLLLSLQLAEHDVAFTLCLNMSDEPDAPAIDVDALSDRIGVPVVAVSALRRWNLEKLKRHAVRPSQSRLAVQYPQAVEDAWVQQYMRMVGTIDLDDQKFDEQCLRLLNRRQAWQFHMLPMIRGEENLNIATDAESLVRAVNFSAKKLDEPIYFQIAERQQLKDFLMRHYPVPDHIAQYAESLR